MGQDGGEELAGKGHPELGAVGDADFEDVGVLNGNAGGWPDISRAKAQVMTGDLQDAIVFFGPVREFFEFTTRQLILRSRISERGSANAVSTLLIGPRYRIYQGRLA